MATLVQIQAPVNARLADFWPKVKTKQATYASNHAGRYWQGLVFSTVPDDGALITPDFTVKPADQNTSWSDVSVASDLPATVEAQMRIDVYEAPGPHFGFFLTVRVSKSGITYRRVGHVEDNVEVTTGSWAAE